MIGIIIVITVATTAQPPHADLNKGVRAVKHAEVRPREGDVRVQHRAERREVAKAAEHGLAEPYIEALEHHHVRAA